MGTYGLPIYTWSTSPATPRRLLPHKMGGGGGGGHVVDVPLGLFPYQTAGATPAQCNRGRTRTRTEILRTPQQRTPGDLDKRLLGRRP